MEATRVLASRYGLWLPRRSAASIGLATWLTLRIGSALVTMLGASIFVFAVMRLVPGGYVDVILGMDTTPEARASLATRYGLDRPLPEQYIRWLGTVASGDFGVTLSTQEPVREEFIRRAPVTVELALTATAMSALMGIPAGFLAALGGKAGVGIGRVFGVVGLSIPDFVLGSTLVFIFSSASLGPTVGAFVPLVEDPIGNLRSMILPAITLGVVGAAAITRTTRDAVLSVLTEPYVVAAVARGQRPLTIATRHIARNATIPVLTVVVTRLGYLLGGAVIAEQLFSIPGFGVYVLSAVERREYAIVQAGALIAASVFISLNMLADLAYALIDPRIGAARTAPE